MQNIEDAQFVVNHKKKKEINVWQILNYNWLLFVAARLIMF